MRQQEYKEGDKIFVPNWDKEMVVGRFDKDKIMNMIESTGREMVCKPDEFIITRCGEILRKEYVVKR